MQTSSLVRIGRIERITGKAKSHRLPLPVAMIFLDKNSVKGERYLQKNHSRKWSDQRGEKYLLQVKARDVVRRKKGNTAE